MKQIELKQNSNIYPHKKRIKFCFSDKSSIEYDYNLIYSINPKIIITKSIIDEEGQYTINLPEKIGKEDLVEFLFLYIGNNKHDDHNYFINSRNKFIKIMNHEKSKFESFLKILLFFNNETFNNFLINNIFIPEMKKEKIVDFLLFSYELLELNNNSESRNNSSYLNLFNLCFEKIGNNEKYLVKYYNKLKILEKDILRKIIEKIFYNLLNTNCLLNTDEDSEYSINLDGCVDADNDSNNDNKSITRNMDIPNKMDEVGEEYVSIDYNKINHSSSTMKKENNYIIKLEDFRKLINILMDINNIFNIYDLLSTEYINILSNESIYDSNTNNKKKYTFQKKFLFNSIKNNNLIYEECPLDLVINNKTIILVIFYQPFERSINVCIKLKDNKNNDDKLYQHLNDSDYCFKLFTFYTSIELLKGYNIFNTRKHNCIISLTNNKSMYNIFKSSINNLELDDNNNNFLNRTMNEEWFAIKVEIKLCHIYTALLSYLLHDFSSFSNDNHISKLSKQLFILLLSNKYLDKKNENDIVNSILLWLNDEINIKEDITEIFYNINWENVDDALIFELMVKYSHYISNNESTQLIFFKIFEEKYNNIPLVKTLINNIISASKKINYEYIFSQMKNNQKFNNAYISYNTYLNISNNKFRHIQTYQNQDVPSFDNIISNNKNINNTKKYNISSNNLQLKNINNTSANSNASFNTKKNKNFLSCSKINKKNISVNQSRTSFPIKIRKEENILEGSKNNSKHRENSTLEKMKKLQRKIKINPIYNIKKISKINNINYKKLKPSMTKNSSHDFMKLTLNSTNTSLLNFQNLFNKSFNSINNKYENKSKNKQKGKSEKEEKSIKKKYSTSFIIKKKNNKIKIRKK